jgi:hypothetical protein
MFLLCWVTSDVSGIHWSSIEKYFSAEAQTIPAML